jgi:hypothetical protein
MRRVLLALAVAFAGCGSDVERGPAEARNLAALETIPTPQGAVEVDTETFSRTAPDTSDGPIVDWATDRRLRLTGGETARRVIARAETGLKRAGWQMVGSVEDFYLNARRQRSCLHYLTSPEPPSTSDEIPEFTATDEAPAEDETDPGDAIARGLMLIVSGC